MYTFRDLRLALRKDQTNLTSIKAALVGDTATQFLAIALKGMAIERGFKLELFEADYSQVEMQMLDPESVLHSFHPKYIFVFQSSQKLLESYWRMERSEQETLAEKRISEVQQFCKNTDANVIYLNYPLIDDNIFGSYSSKVSFSFSFQLRTLNYRLMENSILIRNLFIVDIDGIQQKYGRDWLFDSSVYTNTEMVLSINAQPYVASRCMDVVLSLEGKFRKCLILDLDNTLWGGIVGDDGWENIQIGHGLGIGKCFTNLQLWIKQLEKRGVIICICSKNDEEIAKEPFIKHPEMILRLDDIAVFIANWDNKVDNIKRIQKTLNIGFDSMVFVDDNPFERNIVRENIPELTVPELPDDPSNYFEYLTSLNLFETASFSDADSKRNEQYRIEAQRVVFSQSFTDEKNYLRHLNMVSEVECLTKYNIPRVAQLSQRSNQFNLRTIRYSEMELHQISNDKSYIGLAFSLKDKFGDNGIVSVVVLHKETPESYFIESFFMSCRVLKRGMENFIINVLVEQVKRAGGDYLIGEYIPTAKNGMVENLFEELGFNKLADQNRRLYRLDVKTYINKETFINRYLNG